MSNIELIKTIRAKTGAGVMDVKRALEEADDDQEKTLLILKEKGFEEAEKHEGREVTAGKVYAYIHTNGRIGSLVQINCETDFVARTSEFQNLCQEIAMQVAAMNPENGEALLEQEYIRDPQKKVEELVKEVIAKTGENVVIKRFARYEL